MLPTLYCLAGSTDHAENIVAQLQAAGVPTAHLSALMFNDDTKDRPAPLRGFQYAGAPNDSDAEKTVAGASAGTAAGAAVGVMTMGLVGLTPLLMIAPLVVGTGAAAGAAVGAAAGASGSNLADFGIPEAQRESFEKKLAAGAVLLAVRTDDEGELEKANAVMEQAGAKDVGLFRLTKKFS